MQQNEVAMLDTIKIYNQDFRVSDGANLTIQPNTIDYSTGDIQEIILFKDSKNQPVYGSKAYINNDRFNLTIKGMPKGGVNCFIQLSVPKACNGDNYYPVSHNETKQVFSELQKELTLLGIGLNVSDSKLSRVDSFKNVSDGEMFSTYSPVLSLLKAKRQLRRDYGTTFTWQNTRREICAYDKNFEVQSRGLSLAGYPANNIRFEYRLKNSDVCLTEYGFNTVYQLENNLDAVRDTYKTALEKHLFCLDVQDIEIITGNELEKILTQYKETQGMRWLNIFLRDYGAYSVSKMAGIETVKTVINKLSDGDRTKAWRTTKLLESLKQNYELMRDGNNGKTLSDLYMELKEKVLND